MSLSKYHAVLPASRILVFTLTLVGLVSSAAAQKVVVQDAGGGRKLELHYNAAGQVVETRTIGPDGKLMQKDVLEYPPGAYLPQTASTSYWPNGQIQKFTRNTYDNNSNFTGEFIQVFDQAGKQTAGHRLTHDPQTNVYHCYEWNVAAQDYKEKPCPSGEESAETPEQVKKFTQAEATQQLQRARAAAMQTTAQAPMAGQTPVPSNTREVALVLPTQIRTGERVSGSVVEDPGRYGGIQGLTVTKLTLPFTPTGAQATLAGWVVEMSGEPPQRADGPIALTVPPGQLELAVAIHPANNAEQMVAARVPLPQNAKAKGKASPGYLAPAVCMKDDLCLVRGAFNGDSSKTFAAVEERPAKIVVETSDAAYIAVPDRTEAGSRPLAIAEGSKAILFPVVVATLVIKPEYRELKKGENMLLSPTLSGPEELPDEEWLPGNYPPWSLKQAQQLIPTFQMPRKRSEHEEREAKEKKAEGGKDKGKEKGNGEEGGGEILLVVKNASPGQVSFRDASNGSYVFNLKAESFSRGEFSYKFVVEASQTGTFNVVGHAIPLLAPLAGQEFPLTPEK